MPNPKALPSEAVLQVWARVAPSMHRARRLHSGEVSPSKDELFAFVRIALIAPHYAGVTDIANALGMDRQKINRVKMEIVRAAREHRDNA